MQQVIQAEIPPGGSTVEAELPLKEAFDLWDEFDPHLYSLGLGSRTRITAPYLTNGR